MTDVDAVVRSVPAHGFLYAKVPVANVMDVRRLTDVGFAVVDVNVTLQHDDSPPRPLPADVEIVEAEKHHELPLLDIAGSSFRHSRFHLDPGLPRALADHVKREWLRSCLEGARGDALLCAVVEGRAAGFLAALAPPDAAVIDLIAVDDQGRGIGGALVSAFVERYAGTRPVLRVGTQIANVHSLRLYNRHGFRVESAAYVLHLHRA